MKKIIFDDMYGSTQAVIDGYKTMKREIVPEHQIEFYYGWLADMSNRGFDDISVEFQSFEDAMINRARYKVGEIVAVAQAYRDIKEYNPKDYEDVALDCGVITASSHPYSSLRNSCGWLNKMYVKADLMPYQIRITDVKVEKLQNISREDIIREGISYDEDSDRFYIGDSLSFFFAREAFSVFIDKVSGEGTWEKNPFCFCYELELVK